MTSRTRLIRMIRLGWLPVAVCCAVALFVYPATANLHFPAKQSRIQAFQAATLEQRIHNHQLAATTQVLQSQAPSVIVQFPLFPSGVKKAFPKATGVVTIVQGNPEVSLLETVTVDVEQMPPDTTFTIFFIEAANKPFGHVQYVADLHTRSDGSGDVTFQTITLVAFAIDSNNPNVSKDQSGDASGTLKGTPFDGGSPPLHAGPQAMTDGQNDPVF